MPFRFGSFGLLSKLEMYKTPLTDCSTVHTVGFRHLETRPVDFYSRPRTPRLCPPTQALVFFLSYPYSRLAIDYETNLSTIYRNLADISKTAKKRSKKRKPEHARTWTGPKPEYQNRTRKMYETMRNVISNYMEKILKKKLYPRGYIEIREEEEKMKRKKKRRREREEEKKQIRREENKSVRTREKEEAEKKGKKRISVRCNGT
ncbi:hypothetical protein V1477_012807 [Vespula maculifrons]|uniref:Uncharacterized protein n=1 Tax=Vespula maculifrons TaxID=7453 RepID=A0ABD2BU50_VESMC